METITNTVGQSAHRGNKTKFDTKTLVTLSMFTGIAYMVTVMSNVFPKVSGFLEFDFKDMVIVIGGFLYGPLASIFMTVAVSLLQFFTISSSGVIGLVMNVIATGSFCGTASLIYWYRPNFKGAVIGLISGAIAMTTLMLLWNYAITPLYMNIPREAVVAMLVPIFLPFNLVKAGLNMGAVLTVYPSVCKALTMANLAKNPEVENRETTKKKTFAISLGIFAVFIVAGMFLTGVISSPKAESVEETSVVESVE